jgi:hypothetical protein
MNEILDVTEMNEEPFTSRSLNSPSSRAVRTFFSERMMLERAESHVERDPKKFFKGHRSAILQIKTMPDGFNFGRTYYFKPSAEIPCRNIVEHLSSAANSARLRAENKSRFKKNQEFVKGYQESLPYQILVAFLILLVSIPLS